MAYRKRRTSNRRRRGKSFNRKQRIPASSGRVGYRL